MKMTARPYNLLCAPRKKNGTVGDSKPHKSFKKEKERELLAAAQGKSDQVLKEAQALAEEERRKVVDAYYEAKRLGMETQWNVADALSRCALNGRKARQTSLAAQIMDTLSHQKFTQNGTGARKPITSNPRGMLDG